MNEKWFSLDIPEIEKKLKSVQTKTQKLGEKLEFDAAGLAKKLKPFNVKAGQKYLQQLIDAIKKVSIITTEKTENENLLIWRRN